MSELSAQAVKPPVHAPNLFVLTDEPEQPSSHVASQRIGRPGPLVTILVLGGLLRLVLWLWFDGQSIHIWDEREYNQLAVNLLQSGQFAFEPGIATSLRPPLYPAFLAAVYGVFGLENFQAVRLLQAGLSLATVVILYQLGALLTCRRVALWLAGLYCFYPSLLVYNNLLLTEVLFTFLFCAACTLLVAAHHRRTLKLLVVAGGLLGLAALTRSIVSFLPPLLALYLIWSWKGRIRERILAACAVLLAFAATIAPWAIRNSLLERTFVTIDTMGGRNFMMGNYEYTAVYRSWATIDQSTGEKSWISVLSSFYPDVRQQTQGVRDKLALRYGLKYVEEHPGQTVVRDLIKLADFWGLERELISGAAQGYFGAIPRAAVLALALLICGGYAAVVLVGIFGALMTPPLDRRYHALLFLIILFFCGVHALVFGHSRYHLPIIPFVLVYTAGAVVNAGNILNRRSLSSYWLAGSVCGLFLISWLWRFAVDLQLHRFG
jgi:4-amino-4-deoxy-L-arabinose transferase-like glycosyltransferase